MSGRSRSASLVVLADEDEGREEEDDCDLLVRRERSTVILVRWGDGDVVVLGQRRQSPNSKCRFLSCANAKSLASFARRSARDVGTVQASATT